jgi:hypothetical protein
VSVRKPEPLELVAFDSIDDPLAELRGSSQRKNEETTPSVTRDEFLRDSATILRRAETEGPIVIIDNSGKPTAIVSAPREEPSSIR